MKAIQKLAIFAKYGFLSSMNGSPLPPFVRPGCPVKNLVVEDIRADGLLVVGARLSAKGEEPRPPKALRSP